MRGEKTTNCTIVLPPSPLLPSLMGQQLSSLSSRLSSELTSVLDASPHYKQQLRQLLAQYAKDPTLSDQQILQWCGERLVSDVTDTKHEIGSIFLPRLSKVDLQNFDARTITQCIAQAAMQYLEGEERTENRDIETETDTSHAPRPQTRIRSAGLKSPLPRESDPQHRCFAPCIPLTIPTRFVVLCLSSPPSAPSLPRIEA